MALPFSCDQFHTPPMQFQPNNPPFVPQVMVLPEAHQILVPVCAVVATEAGMTANTPPRIFAYNMLSENNYANQAFSDLVKAVCDFAVYKVRNRQAHTAMTVLHECAQELLSGFSSLLVMSYGELASLLPPNVLQAAAHNADVYQNYLNLFAQLYQQPAQSQGYGQQHMSHGRHVSQQQAYGRAAPRVYGQSGAVGGHPAAASRLTSQTTQQAEQGQPSRGRTSSRRKEDVKPEQETKIEDNVIIGEVEKMDREAHCIVYFGQEYKVPTAPIRRALEQAVEIHEDVSESKDFDSTPYISTLWQSEASLDELIAITRAKFLGEAENNVAVYVGNGFVVKPIFTTLAAKENMDRLFDELRKSNTFADVARTMKLHAKQASDGNGQNIRAVLDYLSQIDRLLTPMVNYFLQEMIDYSGLRIDSFIEDGEVVFTILNEKFKSKYNRAFTDYQRGVLEHLFSHLRMLPTGLPSDDPVAAVTWYGDEDGQRVYWENVTEAYSLIYINATAKELGYNVTNKAKQVTAANSPMLNRLFRAIQKSSTAMPMATRFLVITSDDARYALNIVAGDQVSLTLKEI